MNENEKEETSTLKGLKVTYYYCYSNHFNYDNSCSYS